MKKKANVAYGTGSTLLAITAMSGSIQRRTQRRKQNYIFQNNFVVNNKHGRNEKEFRVRVACSFLFITVCESVSAICHIKPLPFL